MVADIECPEQYNQLAQMGFQFSRNAFGAPPSANHPLKGYYGFSPQIAAVADGQTTRLRLEVLDWKAEHDPLAKPLYVHECCAWSTQNGVLNPNHRVWVFKDAIGADTRMCIKVFSNGVRLLEGHHPDAHMQRAGLVSVGPGVMYFDKIRTC